MLIIYLSMSMWVNIRPIMIIISIQFLLFSNVKVFIREHNIIK